MKGVRENMLIHCLIFPLLNVTFPAGNQSIPYSCYTIVSNADGLFLMEPESERPTSSIIVNKKN